MPAASQDLHALWSSHRGLLHSPSAWNLANPAVSLTYVPTGAGFTGPAQLQRFCALFPPEHHPFHADQIFRYNNQCQTVGCAVDEQQRVLTEEIVLSSLHLERLDYLMPGVEATRRAFASPFIFVAKYAANSDLLDSVHVYWDQSSLLKQLDVFHLALHNLIKSTGNAATFENELATLPIVDGMRISRRLVHPTPHNCNHLVSLEALENSVPSSKPSSQTLKLSPIGGLDNISAMAHELPQVSNTRPVHHGRDAGHLSSKVFSQADDLTAAPLHHGMRHVLGPASTLRLGDGSDERVQPAAPLVNARPSIFSEEHDPIKVRPSIAIDPHRNESHLFQESNSPFRPAVPVTNPSRFTSQIFAEPPTVAEKPGSREGPSQLRSHIFEEAPAEPAQAHTAAPRACPFGTDEDPRPSTLRPSPKDHDASQRLAGHFYGSGFVFQDEDRLPNSFSGIHPDGRTNRSTLSLGDADPLKDLPRAAINPRSAMSNQSQLKLGDDDGGVAAVRPSSRVLQPPGGRSTIFLE